jgi:two-component system sensor histidine kinase BarA
MENSANSIELNQLPIIDRQDGLRLAGHNQAFADEILSLFIAELKTETDAFHKLLAENNLVDLQKQIHKLHGACCYTGTPRLKACIYHLETVLKTQQAADLANLLTQLSNEADALIAEHASMHSHASA